MSSFLGVDFFRIVNEGLVDDWAQVYAKVPFEEGELLEKGALFGVLRIKGGKELVSTGSEMFLWLDEYFNKTKENGDLRGLVEGLMKMNNELQAAWVWVVVDTETGKRTVKTMATNGGKVIIVRGGQQMILAGDKNEIKVVVGAINKGDRLGLGVGGVMDKVKGLDSKKILGKVADELSKQVLEETEKAVAGLLLEVKKRDAEEILEEVGEEDFGIKRESAVAEVVSENKVVGPNGLKKKMAGYWFSTFKKKRNKIEVREDKSNKGKVMWLGIVFLVLFVFSVVGGVVKSKGQKIESSWESEISSWQKRESEAKSLLEINPAGARKLLMEVREEVKLSESTWMDTKYEEDWKSYGLKLNESWIEVSGEKKVEPKLFLVLSLVRSKLMGNSLVSFGEEIGLLEKDEGLLVRIKLDDSKKAEVVDSDKERRWKAVGGDGKEAVFLTDNGLVLSGEKEVEFDATVVSPVEVEVFGSGVYVLDAGAGEVWKFTLLGKDIQDRRRWLQPEQEIGIGELVDLDIDGDIWVLGKKGEVSKLRRGSRERFSLEGGPENLVGDRVAVQIEGEKISILDASSSRVVVFNKETGEYMYQLIWEGFSNSKDILYTEDGRLMVLSLGKLYWVE